MQATNDLTSPQGLLSGLAHDFADLAVRLSVVLLDEAPSGIDGVGCRRQGLIKLMRKGGRHLPCRSVVSDADDFGGTFLNSSC